MSDYWIKIVPVDARFVPQKEHREEALELFRRIAPDSSEIIIALSDFIQFFDCGQLFERITCQNCDVEITHEWWQDRMSQDFDGKGFRLQSYPAPCCKTNTRLDKLRYEWSQAFARFAIEALNPGIQKLSELHRRNFEAILETPLTVIYQRL